MLGTEKIATYLLKIIENHKDITLSELAFLIQIIDKKMVFLNKDILKTRTTEIYVDWEKEESGYFAMKLLYVLDDKRFYKTYCDIIQQDDDGFINLTKEKLSSYSIHSSKVKEEYINETLYYEEEIKNKFKERISEVEDLELRNILSSLYKKGRNRYREFSSDRQYYL